MVSKATQELPASATLETERNKRETRDKKRVIVGVILEALSKLTREGHKTCNADENKTKLGEFVNFLPRYIFSSTV